MLWATIILLLRRYRKTHPQQFQLLLLKLAFAARVALLLAAALVCALMANTQVRNLSYTIRQNGKLVGTLQVKEAVNNGRVSLQLQSHVQTRFIIDFTIKTVEEAHYENDVLVASVARRTLNGNAKMDQTLLLQANGYQVNNEGKKEAVAISPIRQTLLSLYLYEPLRYTQVFSNAHQRMLAVQAIAPHHYKVRFPDGAYNEFFYRNGVCQKILIHNSLYKAVLQLKN